MHETIALPEIEGGFWSMVNIKNQKPEDLRCDPRDHDLAKG